MQNTGEETSNSGVYDYSSSRVAQLLQHEFNRPIFTTDISIFLKILGVERKGEHYCISAAQYNAIRDILHKWKEVF